MATTGSLPLTLGSNYVSKPTAEETLQSFRLLPAGSGLTRRWASCHAIRQLNRFPPAGGSRRRRRCPAQRR
jgi:hypothetical protein